MKPVVLVVLDGYGLAIQGKGNCIELAKKPNMDFYWKNYPHCRLDASGEAVGTVRGGQGTSEIGHLHMGAGRIVWQPLPRINNEIRNGKFFKNHVLLDAIKKAKKTRLHLMGLCSDGNVHSNISHLFSLLEMAKKNGVKEAFIHCFLDGRDVGERTAEKYVKQIQSKCRKLGVGKIATIIGRFYSMDRDKNYARTKKAYDLLTLGKGMASEPLLGIKKAYAMGARTDYYIPPIVCDKNGTIKDNDAVIFFNYRTDRARQITYPFTEKKFRGFRRETLPKAHFACFADYDKKIKAPVAFPEIRIKNNLGSVLAARGKRQLRIAETEKYAHVTYFFNSQDEEPNKREDRVLIPSSKVPSYDMKPEMSALEIAEKARVQITNGNYDFVLLNFANCDLVGHSSNINAIVRAVEVVDRCVKKIVDATFEKGGVTLITADHGSAEEKLFADGKPKPSHSCNPVPFIIIGKNAKLRNGGLIDVAPTVLELFGIKKPREMQGNSLISAI